MIIHIIQLIQMRRLVALQMSCDVANRRHGKQSAQPTDHGPYSKLERAALYAHVTTSKSVHIPDPAPDLFNPEPPAGPMGPFPLRRNCKQKARRYGYTMGFTA